MIRYILLLLFGFLHSIFSQTILSADGPGNTYELINSILAPGYDAVEDPDCSHQGFGRHIDEIFDPELNRYVFRFYIHTSPDNDRCLNYDRQRNEIKSYDQSPDSLIATEKRGGAIIFDVPLKIPGAGGVDWMGINNNKIFIQYFLVFKKI